MRASDIYHSYELLRESLLYLAQSERNQLHLINRWFLKSLEYGGHAQLRSFVRELFPIMAGAVQAVDPTGCHPEFFDSLGKTVERIEREYPDMFSPSEFSSCRDMLLKNERTVRAWLGCPTDDDRCEKLATENFFLESPERRTLDRFIQSLSDVSPEETEFYRSIAQAWDTRIQTLTDCAKIPLLETDISSGAIEEFQPFGRIINLRVILQGDGTSGKKDIITFPQLIDHAVSAGVEDELQCAASAVLKLSHELFHLNGNTRTHCSIAFDDARMHTSGRSLGLGFATALLAARSRQIIGRQFSLVSGNTVMTGMVAPTGEVHPLDDEQIREKVKTVFFSPFKCLVLPKDNEYVAEDALRPLTEAFPTRHLELLPIRHLHDAVQHRQVIEVRPYSVKQRLIRRVKHHQTTIAVGSFGLLLVLIAGYFLFVADWDNNPYQVTLYGNDYQIRNRNGNILWKKPYNPPENPRQEGQPLSLFGETLSKQYAVFDLDGDGVSEILLGHNPSKVGFSDSLYCFNSDGTRRWSVPVGGNVITSENEYVGHAFGVHRILTGILDQSNRPRIAVISGSDHYPTYFYLFDEYGKKLGQCLNLGSLSDIATLQAEDRRFLLVTGTHNGFHSGIIILFDPEKIEGMCPQEDSRRVLDPVLPSGTEKMYLKLPRSRIYDLFRGPEKNPFAFLRKCSETAVEIDLYEAIMPTANTQASHDRVSLRYYFNGSMVATAITTSTQYDVLHDMGHQSGLIPAPLSKAYLDSLRGEVEYWDGDKFVRTPTMNRKYLEAVKEKQSITK